jgi:hypothetical protein
MPPIEDPSVADLARTYISQGRQMVTRVPPLPKLEMRQVTVNSVSTGATTCSINLANGEVPDATYAPHYTPSAGDTAWAMVCGKTVLVFAKNVTPGPPLTLP